MSNKLGLTETQLRLTETSLKQSHDKMESICENMVKQQQDRLMEIDQGGPVVEDPEESQRRLDAATREIQELRDENQRQKQQVKDEQSQALLLYEQKNAEQASHYDELLRKMDEDRREQEVKAREIEREREQADRDRVQAQAKERDDMKRAMEEYE